MKDDDKFNWSFTIVYVPSRYDTFYKQHEDMLEAELKDMIEYKDALDLINKVKQK
jgi:hypothetical protein